MATRSKPLKLWDAEKFKNVNPVSLKYWDRYENRSEEHTSELQSRI